MNIFDQLPRISAYDPGAVGEGGIDPIGFSAVADRIAEIIAPGVRARMSQPRFVTVSAVGAIAYQNLLELTADQGNTTVDIAFEWLVVEAFIRNSGNGLQRFEGVPGNQKARRAIAKGERLSLRTYLNGPRVFGFTGVYRPFSRNSFVLNADDGPDENAVKLVHAWERDWELNGYVENLPNTNGGKLRNNIAEVCKRSLEKAQCDAPPTGDLFRKLSDYLAPREAKRNERIFLRELISRGEHQIRNEIVEKLTNNPLPEKTSQRGMAQHLLSGASEMTKRALQATIDYEEAASMLHVTFQNFLSYTGQQHGSIISRSEASNTPGLKECSKQIGGLVSKAIDSVAELGDSNLSDETSNGFQLFKRNFTPQEFLDTLIERHEDVQAKRKNLSWLEQISGELTVRPAYRSQEPIINENDWIHPMRLVTLARFIEETKF